MTDGRTDGQTDKQTPHDGYHHTLGGPRRNIAMAFGIEKLKVVWHTILTIHTGTGQIYSPAAEVAGSVCLKPQNKFNTIYRLIS